MARTKLDSLKCDNVEIEIQLYHLIGQVEKSRNVSVLLNCTVITREILTLNNY